ncbi:aminotransferase class V-fold PLP-dependent enzyme [Panacibacter sp. DH6]|uniref:Aminotransferase class V-fold PLP-dependent enzyme n=1 Tax=Panacibacter microcysteis TaxID=2793269 RepID=A0A931E4G0_9BACT|nr:aminotransferase class V-fold PLP-dependent enzyme [Panacibacter microcysteis]MBG9375095.1 aminotransferase class V-fold PLP-dependent enzyme [Panacibacter microcysteis]
MKRRDALKNLSLIPIGSGLALGLSSTEAAAATPPAPKRDLFKELGVRTFINAAGTYTFMTGSLMQDEVVEAIQATSRQFCLLDELQDKAGEKIAALTKAQSAVVTAGCFSAITLGLAGVLTGNDPEKAAKLPHLEGTGMKSEVIIQKGHMIGYSQALTNTGCKIVYVETIDDVEKAINDKTALLWFLNVQSDQGQITHEQWVALGKKHNIPTMIDIAADVPPVSNLWKFNEMGFDLVCISGGKAMRGPQSAGLLMGRKDLIAAARVSMPPRGSTIGRGMKVNKEEIIGMYVALEHYMAYDHDKEWKEWEARVATIRSAIQNINGVITEVKVPKLGNVTPTLHVTWQKESVKLTSKELQEKLRAGSPSIEIVNNGDEHISITTWVMRAGEEKIVAQRLKDELSAALA